MLCENVRPYTVCSWRWARRTAAASPRTSCFIKLTGTSVRPILNIFSSTIEAIILAVCFETPCFSTRSLTIRDLSHRALPSGCSVLQRRSASANSSISMEATSILERLSLRSKWCSLRATAASSYCVAVRTAFIMERI